MYIGRVSGTVVATIKNELFESRKLLVVDRVNLAGESTAEYDIALLTSILDQHAARPLSSIEPSALLRWAVGAKLAIVEHAHRAVTHCLQTLGGYGYMEDYSFEKRLRDVSTLKSLHGAPDQLKLFLNELARAEEGG